VASRKSGSGARGKLVWTDRALRDLKAIDDYIAADDPDAAARWIDKLFAAAQRAAQFPLAGHVVRERGDSQLRQVLVRTYRIVYRIKGSSIHVLTVFEGRHLLPEEIK
jgi:addiction module RelE/StbE family toxin